MHELFRMECGKPFLRRMFIRKIFFPNDKFINFFANWIKKHDGGWTKGLTEDFHWLIYRETKPWTWL